VEQGVVALLQAVIVLGMMFYVSTSLPFVGLAPAPLLAGWRALVHAHRDTAVIACNGARRRR
jgi:ABC-type bacteriocin/lantibiotic exporter with double-glycine peptidase domain